MRKLPVFIFAFLNIITANGQQQTKIRILHTNDMHSRLIGYSPESSYSPDIVNNDKTIGGFSRISSIIKNETAGFDGVTLVLDAGDFLMGTLFQGIEPATGFELRLMKTMGYDVVCIGNHEFDLGPDKLAEIVGSGARLGSIPPVLLSNAVFDENDPADDALEKLYTDGVISRKYILQKGGLKIGFFSLMGKVADDNAAFAPPVTFSKQVKAAKKMVKDLEAEKCDLIICLSHSGVDKDKNGSWAGEDAELASKVSGIDVIISGHTHTRLNQPLLVNGIPVVQAGEYGQFVGKLDLTLSNGVPAQTGYSLIPVDDRIAGDMKIESMIGEQKELVTDRILKKLDLSYEQKIAETSFALECNESGDYENSNLAPMVADAIHNYVNKHVRTGTDVSIVAVGVVRDNVQPGVQAAPDIFRIMSMGSGSDEIPGYPLARVYVTGKELKSIMEILLASGKSTPANYCYYSGLKAEFDPSKGLLKKVQKIKIIRPDGSVKDVDFSKKSKELYSITANSYMLKFIGIIKKMSFGLINVVPKDAKGQVVSDIGSALLDMNDQAAGLQEGKEWLAILEYLRSMKDVNGNGIPDIDDKYRVPLKCLVPVNQE